MPDGSAPMGGSGFTPQRVAGSENSLGHGQWRLLLVVSLIRLYAAACRHASPDRAPCIAALLGGKTG
ncbi:hypothetical protein THIX_10699 [Thiomonas sp. X19]|nr:hypothetical protein THIX_10699 [Thiomonas sp. X19]